MRLNLAFYVKPSTITVKFTLKGEVDDIGTIFLLAYKASIEAVIKGREICSFLSLTINYYTILIKM